MAVSNRSKDSSFRFILTDDLLQQVDVFGESFAASGRERTSRERTIFFVGFRDGNESFLLKCANMRREIAIRHVQRVAQFCEREFRRRGKRRHDGQSALLVDHAIELEK